MGPFFFSFLKLILKTEGIDQQFLFNKSYLNLSTLLINSLFKKIRHASVSLKTIIKIKSRLFQSFFFLKIG